MNEDERGRWGGWLKGRGKEEGKGDQGERQGDGWMEWIEEVEEEVIEPYLEVLKPKRKAEG